MFPWSVINNMHGSLNYNSSTEPTKPVCTRDGETDYKRVVPNTHNPQ